MDINLFDFYLPEELIAQTPAEKRDESRLLAVNLSNLTFEDRHFFDILDYLNPGDVLVRNNTKVIPARLLGIKEKTGAHCELLLLKQIEGDLSLPLPFCSSTSTILSCRTSSIPS